MYIYIFNVLFFSRGVENAVIGLNGHVGFQVRMNTIT